MTTARVYECGGCDRLYLGAQAVTEIEEDPGKWREYDTPRCPYCGTERDHRGTVMETVDL